MTPPINPPTHPPTQQTIHLPIGGGSLYRFLIFKQNWNIAIFSRLIEFYWHGGSSLGGGWVTGWMGGGGGGWQQPHTPAHTRECMHAHTHRYWSTPWEYLSDHPPGQFWSLDNWYIVACPESNIVAKPLSTFCWGNFWLPKYVYLRKYKKKPLYFIN